MVRVDGWEKGQALYARDEARKTQIGPVGKKVKSRKQAIAIGLSEALKSGAKGPKKKKSK